MNSELRESARRIGHLYPVLVDKHGNVLDGNHRLDIDRKWKKVKLRHIDNERDGILVRIISNNVRRQVPAKEKERLLGKLADIYLKEGVMPGDLTHKIAQETGMSYQWVAKYIPVSFKDRLHAENARARYVPPAPQCRANSADSNNGELDLKLYHNTDFISIILSKTLYQRIEQAAEIMNMTPRELVYASIVQMLSVSKRARYQSINVSGI